MKLVGLTAATVALSTFACSTTQAAAAYTHEDISTFIADAHHKLSPEQQTVAKRLLRGDNRKLQSLMDMLNGLVASLPKDSRFDPSTDYTAAVNYLTVMSYQPPPATFITAPTTEAERHHMPTTLVPFTTIRIPTHDEIVPDLTSGELALLDFIFRGLPVRESATVNDTFAPGEDAMQLIQSRMFGVATGDRKFHKWTGDHTSDAMIASIVWEDFGQHRIVLSDTQNPLAFLDGVLSPYVVDFEFLSEFEVKPGFAKFGAAAYFGLDRQLTHIVRHGVPYTNPTSGLAVHPDAVYSWGFVKRAFVNALLFDVTARDHLFTSHLTSGNALVMATRKHLDSAHPLRALLTPFGFGTVKINNKATQSLIGPQGILVRMFSMTPAGLQAYMASLEAADSGAFQTFPEKVKAQNLASVDPNYEPTSYEKDGLRFYAVVHKFVLDYVNTYYHQDCTNDPQTNKWWEEMELLRTTPHAPSWTRRGQGCAELADVLATYIVSVTGEHYHVGTTIQSIVHHPCAASFNLLDPLTLTDLPSEYNCGAPGATLYGYLLISGSQLRQPKIVDDFSHVNSNAWAPSSANKWAPFQADLMALDADIKADNLQRNVPFYSFLPSEVETSVTV